MKNRSEEKKKGGSKNFAEKREKALANAERQIKDIQEGHRSHEPRRLHVGDVFIHEGIKQVVWFINESRAAIAPLNSPIKWRRKEEDNKIQFLAKDNAATDVAPTSQVEILKSYGREGLAKYLDERGDSINDTRKANMAKANKTKKEKGDSTGKLGGYKGHSITSVIRAFGKAGWTLEEAREWFRLNKIEVADNTIKIQIRRGANGDQEGAPLSKKELAEMKPEVEEKPKKSKDKSKKDKGKKKAKPAKDEDEDAEEEEADEEETEEKPAKKDKADADEEEEADEEE